MERQQARHIKFGYSFSFAHSAVLAHSESHDKDGMQRTRKMKWGNLGHVLTGREKQRLTAGDAKGTSHSFLFLKHCDDKHTV